MMKSWSLEEYKNIEGNITKDKRNPFRLKKRKEKSDTTIKDIINLFRIK